MLVAILFASESVVGNRIDADDLYDAMTWLDKDDNIGWSRTFSVIGYCLLNSNSYPITMLIELKKGERL